MEYHGYFVLDRLYPTSPWVREGLPFSQLGLDEPSKVVLVRPEERNPWHSR
jgi:hypothetical protein